MTDWSVLNIVGPLKFDTINKKLMLCKPGGCMDEVWRIDEICDEHNDS